jgi:hypothetical protein
MGFDKDWQLKSIGPEKFWAEGKLIDIENAGPSLLQDRNRR